MAQRLLPPANQRVVRIFERIADAVGHPIDPGARVLDFGAGAGRHVAEFLDEGYDAVGVDQAHTSHEIGRVETDRLFVVSAPEYRLPFPDDSFDLVYSTSVMEHVTEPSVALAEIARVLRPDGLSIHVFPSRWRPIEPHIFTPFGGRFSSYVYFRLCAALGVRNDFQRDLSAREVALRNVQYAKTGLNYPSAAEWELRSRAHFRRVQWAERAYIEGAAPISALARRLRPVASLPGLPRLYRTFHTRVLVLSP